MSNDVGTEEERGRRDTEAVRDDIMKRLLDYQRRQRGEAEAVSSVWATPPQAQPTETAAPMTDEEPQASEAPAEAGEPAAPAPEPSQAPEPPEAPEPSSDVRGRVDVLQVALDGVGAQLGELRQTFQDMAIAADERLAEIEAALARVREDAQEGP